MFTEVFQFLTAALKDMNYDVSSVTPETPLGPAGLDLESLSVAEIALQVEDTYGLRFDEDETEQLALMTVGELAHEIVGRAAKASA
jgi:acyl carrier protein